MYARRSGHVAALLAGRIYVVGGIGPFSKAVEKFNPRLKQWESGPRCELNVPRFTPAATAIDGRLYIIGGEDAEAGIVHDTIECLTPQLGDEPGGCKLLPRRLAVARRHSAAIAWDDAGSQMLWVHGGVDTAVRDEPLIVPVPSFDSIELVSLSEKEPDQHLIPTDWPRRGHTGICLPSRGLFLFGGHAGDGKCLPSVLHFVGFWPWLVEVTPSMIAGRSAHVTALAEGFTYMFGGVDTYETHEAGRASLSSSERFNPSTSAWEPVPPMLQGRNVAAAVTVKVGALAAGPPVE
eukprot:UN1071